VRRTGLAVAVVAGCLPLSRTLAVVNPLAAELSKFPESVARLRASHVVGDRGECVVCSGQQQPVRWPCNIVTVADAAAELIERPDR